MNLPAAVVVILLFHMNGVVDWGWEYITRFSMSFKYVRELSNEKINSFRKSYSKIQEVNPLLVLFLWDIITQGLDGQ